MAALLRGVWLVLVSKRLWPYVFIPLLLAALLYAGIFFGGLYWLIPLLKDRIAGDGLIGTVVGWLGNLLWIAVCALFANLTFVGVIGLFSALFWDSLSAKVEEIVFGSVPRSSAGCGLLLWDAAARIGISAMLFVVGLVLSPFCGISIAVTTGLLCLLDFSSCAYLRRGISIGGQMNQVFKSRAAPGYIAASAFASTIPFLFVFLIPGMVAGGTILCRQQLETNR